MVGVPEFENLSMHQLTPDEYSFEQYDMIVHRSMTSIEHLGY
jgi:hypothetical protein